MTNITNNFAAGSCIFQAGSTLNGDIHIENCTFNQGTKKDKEESSGDSAGRKEESEKSQHRGPQPEFLFIEGEPSWSEQGKMRHSTVENQAVARQEQRRLMTYLSRHCLSNRMLNATQGDTLNKIIVCFVMQWRDMGLTTKHPSGRAIFRFLTEECGMKTEVSLSSYGNKMSQWLRDKQYDVLTLREVKSCFFQ